MTFADLHLNLADLYKQHRGLWSLLTYIRSVLLTYLRLIKVCDIAAQYKHYWRVMIGNLWGPYTPYRLKASALKTYQYLRCLHSCWGVWPLLTCSIDVCEFSCSTFLKMHKQCTIYHYPKSVGNKARSEQCSSSINIACKNNVIWAINLQLDMFT